MKKTALFIERYFWIFLFTGMAAGLVFSDGGESSAGILKPLLMILMFSVFLKTDFHDILKSLGNLKMILWLVTVYMLILPAISFLIFRIFDKELATAVLLLVAMPSAMAAPLITDILKGNRELSANLSVVTSLVAPATVPFLFWLFGNSTVDIDTTSLLADVAMFIFLPLAAAQVVRKLFDRIIEKYIFMLSPVNILILSTLVFWVMRIHGEILFGESWFRLVMTTVYLYGLFGVLYLAGYFLGNKHDRGTRIAAAVGSAYMNNGMAIVLAAIYFTPYVLVFSVLSELPWNTLPGVFRKLNQFLEKSS